MIFNQFQNLEKADWILVNTFHKLEQEDIDWMAKFLPVKAIGPTIPSMYLDKRIQDDKDYGLSVFKPINNVCMKWLNERASRSVVYVSFGSLAELGAEQMEELAHGLKTSNKYFLWVVRSSEEAKLPKNFSKETSKKGLIVSWCPHLEVLAHEAIGCFITHCGWNSTLEALSLGVPLVAMPQRTDQSTNAKARPYVNNRRIIKRPCTRGLNGLTHPLETVEAHIFRHRFAESYVMWIYHGETEVQTANVYTQYDEMKVGVEDEMMDVMDDIVGDEHADKHRWLL
ncbi:UDP-glycosyltransferase 74F2-like [Forsythia ovata]|uniref:UDP-glycosyltransferase 74F2-like n=1 Tax=Forsythia ovata TaxID=205694 RepID=A0ABD1W527_9LAMI